MLSLNTLEIKGKSTKKIHCSLNRILYYNYSYILYKLILKTLFTNSIDSYNSGNSYV